MGSFKEPAKEHADRSASLSDDQGAVDAVGTGLAAVAYAVLELAEEVGDLRRTIERHLPEPPLLRREPRY